MPRPRKPIRMSKEKREAIRRKTIALLDRQIEAIKTEAKVMAEQFYQREAHERAEKERLRRSVVMIQETSACQAVTIAVMERERLLLLEVLEQAVDMLDKRGMHTGSCPANPSRGGTKCICKLTNLVNILRALTEKHREEVLTIRRTRKMRSTEPRDET